MSYRDSQHTNYHRRKRAADDEVQFPRRHYGQLEISSNNSRKKYNDNRNEFKSYHSHNEQYDYENSSQESSLNEKPLDFTEFEQFSDPHFIERFKAQNKSAINSESVMSKLEELAKQKELLDALDILKKTGVLNTFTEEGPDHNTHSVARYRKNSFERSPSPSDILESHSDFSMNSYKNRFFSDNPDHHIQDNHKFRKVDDTQNYENSFSENPMAYNMISQFDQKRNILVHDDQYLMNNIKEHGGKSSFRTVHRSIHEETYIDNTHAENSEKRTVSILKNNPLTDKSSQIFANIEQILKKSNEMRSIENPGLDFRSSKLYPGMKRSLDESGISKIDKFEKKAEKTAPNKFKTDSTRRWSKRSDNSPDSVDNASFRKRESKSNSSSHKESKRRETVSTHKSHDDRSANQRKSKENQSNNIYKKTENIDLTCSDEESNDFKRDSIEKKIKNGRNYRRNRSRSYSPEQIPDVKKGRGVSRWDVSGLDEPEKREIIITSVEPQPSKCSAVMSTAKTNTSPASSTISSDQSNLKPITISLMGFKNHFSVSITDQGNHWCWYCNVYCLNMSEFFKHVATDGHRKRLPKDDKPWVKHRTIPDFLANKQNDNPINIPCKGIEFLQPVESLYCSLCHYFSAEIVDAEQHMLTEHHNDKFKEFVKLNPYYEKSKTKAMLLLSGSSRIYSSVETVEEPLNQNVILLEVEVARLKNELSQAKAELLDMVPKPAAPPAPIIEEIALTKSYSQCETMDVVSIVSLSNIERYETSSRLSPHKLSEKLQEHFIENLHPMYCLALAYNIPRDEGPPSDSKMSSTIPSFLAYDFDIPLKELKRISDREKAFDKIPSLIAEPQKGVSNVHKGNDLSKKDIIVSDDFNIKNYDTNQVNNSKNIDISKEECLSVHNALAHVDVNKNNEVQSISSDEDIDPAFSSWI